MAGVLRPTITLSVRDATEHIVPYTHEAALIYSAENSFGSSGLHSGTGAARKLAQSLSQNTRSSVHGRPLENVGIEPLVMAQDSEVYV